MAIAFTVNVDDRDWDPNIGGWRCPALEIPGSQVDDLYVSGARVDSGWYEVLREHSLIRWVRPERPAQAVVSIKLTQELSTQELTSKWKQLAIVLPVVSSILVAVIGGVFGLLKPSPNTNSNATTNTSTARSSGPRVIPQELAQLGNVQNAPDWMNQLSAYYRLEGANAQQANPNTKFSVGVVEHQLKQATSEFTWVLSTEPSYEISSQAFRITAGGLVQPLSRKGDKHRVEFSAPECEKDDKLVAVVSVVWTQNSIVQDILSTFRSEAQK